MNKRGFSYSWFFVIIMVIVGLAMAQHGMNAKDGKELFDKLNWTNISTGAISSLEISANNSQNYYVSVIIRIAEKGVDYAGYAIFELGKLAAKVAMDNPDLINYKVLFSLLILSLLAPLIYPAFMIITSLILIMREWFANRKEKKRLKELEDAHLER